MLLYAFICHQNEDRENIFKVKTKGLHSLIKYSESRTCDGLKKHIFCGELIAIDKKKASG